MFSSIVQRTLVATHENGCTSEETFKHVPARFLAPVIVWAEEPSGAYREYGYSKPVETRVNLDKHILRLETMANSILMENIPLTVFVSNAGFVVYEHEIYLNPKGMECGGGTGLSLEALGNLYAPLKPAKTLDHAFRLMQDCFMTYMFGSKEKTDPEYDLFVKRLLKHYSTPEGEVDLACLGRELREFSERQQKQLDTYKEELTKKTGIY